MKLDRGATIFAFSEFLSAVENAFITNQSPPDVAHFMIYFTDGTQVCYTSRLAGYQPPPTKARLSLVSDEQEIQ